MPKTMSYKSLGHLAHAPLVYTIGMVEFAPVPEMEKYVLGIMGNLRRDYPEINDFKINTLKLQIDPDGKQQASQTTVEQWSLVSADRTWGVVLGNSRLVVHTVAYKHFEDFSKRLHAALAVVVDQAGISHTRTIGVRYVDNIKQFGNLGIDDQLRPEFAIPEIRGFEPEQGRAEFIYASTEGRLHLRRYHLKDHPGVPHDLLATVDQLVGQSKPLLPISEPFVLVDTDHLYRPSQLEAVDIDLVIKRMDRLHQGASLAFRQVVTENALKAWEKGII